MLVCVFVFAFRPVWYRVSCACAADVTSLLHLRIMIRSVCRCLWFGLGGKFLDGFVMFEFLASVVYCQALSMFLFNLYKESSTFSIFIRDMKITRIK